MNTFFSRIVDLSWLQVVTGSRIRVCGLWWIIVLKLITLVSQMFYDIFTVEELLPLTGLWVDTFQSLDPVCMEEHELLQ